MEELEDDLASFLGFRPYFSRAFAVTSRESTSVDDWNPAPVEGTVVYPIIYEVFSTIQKVVGIP